MLIKLLLQISSFCIVTPIANTNPVAHVSQARFVEQKINTEWPPASWGRRKQAQTQHNPVRGPLI